MSNQPPYGGPPPMAPPPYQGLPPQYAPPPPQYGPPPQYWGPPQGPPPQGPGFGWGSNGFPPPPPKKKSKAPFIVLPIVVVVAGVVALWMLRQVSGGPGDDYTAPQPTYTSTSEPTEGPTEEPTGVPTIPTTRPTRTQPTATRTTTSVPPPPSDSDVVTKNRLYKTGAQRTVNCRESGARANSPANARKYYTQILNCLNRAWPRQVALSGKTFAAPRMIAFTGPVSTPCSGNAPSSFYCSANRTIYMDAATDLKRYRQFLGYSNRSTAMAFLRADMSDTVAHEYGHHLQHLTGILRASSSIQYERSGDAALQMSRRLELQASCLGNVFLGANKSSYGLNGGLFKSQLDWLHAHQGDEYGTRRDHGSREVLPRWANAGFKTRSPASCNTYVAAATYVR